MDNTQIDSILNQILSGALHKSFFAGDGIALTSISHPVGRGRWRRKRDSKRRWKARALRGQWISRTVIVEYRLERWGDAQGGWEFEPGKDIGRLGRRWFPIVFKADTVALSFHYDPTSFEPTVREISADEFYLKEPK